MDEVAAADAGAAALETEETDEQAADEGLGDAGKTKGWVDPDIDP